MNLNSSSKLILWLCALFLSYIHLLTHIIFKFIIYFDAELSHESKTAQKLKWAVFLMFPKQ